MSNLISGKEAKLAWANNKEIEYMPLNKWNLLGGSTPLSIFDRDDVKFRIKPRTITINWIEVPAPFDPEIGDDYYILDQSEPHGFIKIASFSDSEMHRNLIQFGAWRKQFEIKEVIDVLRKAFKGGVE